MKILITGITGQVGHALIQKLSEHHLIGLTSKECNLTQLDQIKKAVDQHQPDLIINAAAYTEVDLAEDNPDLAFEINSNAPKVMAEKAYEHQIPLIHFSTDYVFDGVKKGSYIESDFTNPLSVYGQSKLAGEKAIQEIGGQFYIFRTSWVYSNIGHNFFLTIKRLIHERDELQVIYDQIGVPTSAYFIAENIKKIINQLNIKNKGIYHLVPNEKCSWFTFAKFIISKINLDFDIDRLYPIQTKDFPTKAIRPKNSVLNNHKIQSTFMIEFNDWQNDLDYIINET
jgi:dTDP-4-dehydrorhamnose reductase